MQSMLPDLIAKYPWLSTSKVDSLREACNSLDAARTRWRKRMSRFPRFKTKHGRNAVITVQPGHDDGRRLSFSRQLHLLAVKHKTVDGKLQRITVNKSSSGRYYASCLYRVDEDDPQCFDSSGVLGIDDGLETLITTSKGRKVRHNRHHYRLHGRLNREQRRLARKRQGSSRRQKQRVRVARVHERITNARAYEIHLITTNLVRRAARENQAIAYQRTRITNQMKNRHLARAIADAGWGEIRRQLEYKCKREGVPLFVVDPFRATSKVCSVCGHKLDSLPLHVRKWKCPVCGILHDRDVNAAQNISNLVGREASELTPVESRSATIRHHRESQGHSQKREGHEQAHKRVEARK